MITFCIIQRLCIVKEKPEALLTALVKSAIIILQLCGQKAQKQLQNIFASVAQSVEQLIRNQ